MSEDAHAENKRRCLVKTRHAASDINDEFAVADLMSLAESNARRA